ncbi:DUF6879 family protein [Streptomyces sp. NPDC006784]|uniref:DUF6879 family protein n=1 Tax=Streptomyces sp. NPDC006784 TaxID=3364764 RepID=UPI0036A4323E
MEAGEDIRWLPRHTVPDDLVFPFGGKDWWLIDDRLLAMGHTEAGRVTGHEIIDAPKGSHEAVALRNALWPLAIPHGEYRP